MQCGPAMRGSSRHLAANDRPRRLSPRPQGHKSLQRWSVGEPLLTSLACSTRRRRRQCRLLQRRVLPWRFQCLRHRLRLQRRAVMLCAALLASCVACFRHATNCQSCCACTAAQLVAAEGLSDMFWWAACCRGQMRLRFGPTFQSGRLAGVSSAPVSMHSSLLTCVCYQIGPLGSVGQCGGECCTGVCDRDSNGTYYCCAPFPRFNVSSCRQCLSLLRRLLAWQSACRPRVPLNAGGCD